MDTDAAEIVESEISLLVAIIDVNPYAWGQHERNDPARSHIGFPRFLESILVFLNSFLLLHPENVLAVIAASPNQ